MSLRVIVHDVGHGQAVHAFMPSGHVVVIDLGRSTKFSPLEWLAGQKSTIDSLVVTHPHGDHIDEILALSAQRFSVRQFWRPNWLTEAEIRNANQTAYDGHVNRYIEMSAGYTMPIQSNELIGNPDVSGGVRITHHTSVNCGRSNINNHSWVVVFEYLGLNVVIPGDNESPSWQELLKNAAFLNAAKAPDVFLASHHGRLSGYYSDLFDNAEGIGKPRLCAVSDGRVQDTDAAGRYSYHARGWEVRSRSDGRASKRFCVTTRTDGHIEIEVGQNAHGTFLSVTTA